MSKRIVICCDGSWNAPTQKDSRSGKFNPTNVIKLASAIRLADAHGQQQIVFYDEGVGTGGLLDKWVGGLFGAGLSKNVLDAYRFLVENYEPDDQIYLFGFSRGAYTVRSVVGLITNCGILKREHLAHLSEAYDLYRRRDAASKPNKPASRLFRKRYAHPQESVSIACLGVWDTVGALGIPGLPGLNKRWAFHDNGLSTLVKHAYHALAIDEKRRPFAPVLWQVEKERIANKELKLEQVWFAGSHSNVGGGYADSALSDIALAWMKDKARACGLIFDQDEGEAGVPGTALGELQDSKAWYWNLLPNDEYIRPVCEGDIEGKTSCEAIHPSVKEWIMARTNPPYRPVNLMSSHVQPNYEQTTSLSLGQNI